MFDPVEVFFIEARTGCKCCAYENHYRGPYASWDAAENRAELFKTKKLVSNGYSTEAIYNIKKFEAERLPDGRYIAKRHVFDSLHHVNENGLLEDTDDDADALRTCHFIW